MEKAKRVVVAVGVVLLVAVVWGLPTSLMGKLLAACIVNGHF